jgi:hypothetical protein
MSNFSFFIISFGDHQFVGSDAIVVTKHLPIEKVVGQNGQNVGCRTELSFLHSQLDMYMGSISCRSFHFL